MTGAVIYNINSGWVPPVGYVLEVYDDTSPAVMYADTIWMQLKDCIIIAAGDIYTAGATGGSKTVTLTTTQLPSHSHSGSCGSAGWHSHTATVSKVKNEYGGAYQQNDSYNSYKSGWENETTSSAGAHTHTVTVGATGGGKAFSLMNPYVAVNVWQRVG